MIIDNLTRNEVIDFEQYIKEKRALNPFIRSHIYDMQELDESDLRKKVEDNSKKLDMILSKLNLIFGDSVLLDGEFKDIKKIL